MNATLPRPSDLHPPANPVEYFDQLVDAFERATRSVGPISADFAIGPAVVRTCFGSPRMADLLMPALAHLALAPDATPPDPALTVCLWDSETTRTTIPPPRCPGPPSSGQF